MDENPNELRTERVGSGGVSRGVPILTFLIGIFLGAAIVKPWDLLFPAPEASVIAAPTVLATPIPSMTPEPSASIPAAECAFAGGWRVFALGQPDALGGDGSTVRPPASDAPTRFGDIGNPLRRWVEVDPLVAGTGPRDPRVPFVAIVSDRIGGIGFCPPQEGLDGPPAGARFDAWSLDAAGNPTALKLKAVSVGAASIQVPVFIGSDRLANGDDHWAPGRYVFAVVAGAYDRWFGVEIRTPPGKSSD